MGGTPYFDTYPYLELEFANSAVDFYKATQVCTCIFVSAYEHVDGALSNSFEHMRARRHLDHLDGLTLPQL